MPFSPQFAAESSFDRMSLLWGDACHRLSEVPRIPTRPTTERRWPFEQHQTALLLERPPARFTTFPSARAKAVLSVNPLCETNGTLHNFIPRGDVLRALVECALFTFYAINACPALGIRSLLRPVGADYCENMTVLICHCLVAAPVTPAAN